MGDEQSDCRRHRDDDRASGDLGGLATRLAEPTRFDSSMESLARYVRELTEAFRTHVASDQRWMDARENELQDWRHEIDERSAAINRGIGDLRELVLHQERR